MFEKKQHNSICVINDFIGQLLTTYD